MSVPAGKATGEPGDALARRYAWQIPFGLVLGSKLTREVFLGGYFHLGVGSEGSDREVEQLCDDDDADFENDVHCSALSVRLGVEAQYHFEPAAHLNPWLGYGVGFEAGVQSIGSTEGYRESTTSSGITWAQIGGGFDFRGAVGGGPFAELALGRYMSTHTEAQDQVAQTSIDDRAWHVWTSFGLRLVVRP